MYIHTDAIIAIQDHAMIWLGNMSDSEITEYLDEPGGRIDGLPQSKFAEELLRFYDHDFLWAISSEVAVPVSELLLKAGITDNQIQRHIEEQGFGGGTFSALIILWNYMNIIPIDQSFADGKLCFAGSCSCQSPLS
jgi:hypothetical protein